MGWLLNWASNGPANEILGMPAFWVARVAKLLQLLSGTVIVLDIVGRQRVEEWADSVREILTNLADAQPLKDRGKALSMTAKAFLSYLVALPRTSLEQQRKRELIESEHNWLAGRVWLVTTTVMTVVAYRAFFGDLGCGIFLRLLFAFLASALVSLLFVYLILFNLLFVLSKVVFRPFELVFDVCARAVVGLLQRRELYSLLLVFSLLLLILGTLLELLAS